MTVTRLSRVRGLPLLAVLAVAACSSSSPPAPQSSSPPAQSAPADSSSASPSPSAPAAATNPDLRTSFDVLQQSLSAKIGVAVVALGASSADSYGPWTSGKAWSTSKVPLVIAAMREQPPGSAPSADMKAAITESDNKAAEAIWESLGDPPTAADKVQAVLRDYGDPETSVESRKIRPEYSAFGQTEWSLKNQAQFLSHAACDHANDAVLSMMNAIEDDQRWGIGTIDNTKFKGGWGPSPEGKYLVRQYGLIPASNGTAVVAIAAEPNSGSFDDGKAALTSIAGWISAHLGELPAGSCPAS